MDFEHRLMRAESENEVFSIVIDVSNEVGFPYCSYCIEMPIPFLRRSIIRYDNFPGHGKLKQRRSHNRSKAGAAIYQSGKKESFRRSVYSNEKMVVSEAIDAAGIRIDWMGRIYSSNGTSGVLSLVSDARRRTAGVSARKYMTLNRLLLSAHTKFAGLLLGKLIPESRIKLSARELEVIGWVCEGKTSGEIATILGLATPTVNFHIKNIVEKMYCVNRTHATAKVVALGLLT
jgi:LuxR family transcriptional regulator, quorum-sensing system regulator SolR